MNQFSPIGMFDSGLGGTSIFQEVHALLPNENIIYLADSKNAPYGPRGKKRIIELSIKNTDFLLSMGCKLIVVACNTATTNAIKHLRQTYQVPFIGIEPAIKPAALNTKTNCVGILATKGTLSSELFHQTSNLFANEIEVIEMEGTGLVELIENGELYSLHLKNLLKGYLAPMIEKNIDHLVLGCTHYPYLIPILEELLPNGVKIIDSGEAVAKQTKRVLTLLNLLNDDRVKSYQQFYTTGNNKSVIEDILLNRYQVEKIEI